MVLGWSRVSAQPLPSGFGKRAPDRESSGNPVASLGGCWCDLAGSPTSSLLLLQPWPAPLPMGQFFGRAVGEIGPLPTNPVGFSFSFMSNFNYYLRGLGSLALMLPLFYSSAPKGVWKEKGCFSAYWLRSSARGLFCTFS